MTFTKFGDFYLVKNVNRYSKDNDLGGRQLKTL